VVPGDEAGRCPRRRPRSPETAGAVSRTAQGVVLDRVRRCRGRRPSSPGTTPAVAHDRGGRCPRQRPSLSTTAGAVAADNDRRPSRPRPSSRPALGVVSRDEERRPTDGGCRHRQRRRSSWRTIPLVVLRSVGLAPCSNSPPIHGSVEAAFPSVPAAKRHGAPSPRLASRSESASLAMQRSPSESNPRGHVERSPGASSSWRGTTAASDLNCNA
jgi:hypothetical protein